jgi:hypothetical protein
MNETEAAHVRQMLAEQEARILISRQPEFSGDDLLQQVAFRKVLELAQDPNAVDRRVESAVKEACAATVEWRSKKQAELGVVRRSGGNAERTEADETQHVSRDITQRRAAIQTRWATDADGVFSEESPEEYSSIIQKMARARGQQRPRIHRLAGGHSEE